MVLPDWERADTRVKTHVHWKSCQKDSQRSLSITFYCLCRSHSTTVFSPLGLACEYQDSSYTAGQGTSARSTRALPKNFTLQPVVWQEIRPLGKARAKLSQIEQIAWGPLAPEGHSSRPRRTSGSYLRRSCLVLEKTSQWKKLAKLAGWSPMDLPAKWHFSEYKFDMK